METMNYPELVKTVLTRHTENYLTKVTNLQLIFFCKCPNLYIIYCSIKLPLCQLKIFTVIPLEMP